MDYSIEERFVKAFIRKSHRERLLYELTTPKKRYAGVSRFCHHAKDLLDPSKILMEGEDLERHAYAVNDQIRDSELRNLHILAAV